MKTTRKASSNVAAADYLSGELELLLIQLRSQIITASASFEIEDVDQYAVLLTAKLLVDTSQNKLDEIRNILSRG